MLVHSLQPNAEVLTPNRQYGPQNYYWHHENRKKNPHVSHKESNSSTQM